MKKVYLGLSLVGFLSLLSGIPKLAEGIRLRGPAGVNYGLVGFPLLISVVFFCLYQKKKREEN